jgi:Leucine-rich repeat (LRR) protein
MFKPIRIPKFEQFDESIHGAIDQGEQVFLKRYRGQCRFDFEGSHVLSLVLFHLDETEPDLELIHHLTRLKSLKLTACDLLRTLPHAVQHMEHLENFSIASDLREDLLMGIETIPRLKSLNIQIKKLKIIPEAIHQCSNLESIAILQGEMSSLPNIVHLFSHLQKIELSDLIELIKLPESLINCSSLKTFFLHGCPKLKYIPSEWGLLSNLEIIKLSNLSSLIQLPADFGNLTSLRVLKLSGTPIAALPASLGGCAALEEIEIRDALAGPDALPEGIGQLKHLKSLTIYGGDLEQVPAAIAGCESLERLWLVDCPRLKGLPAELESLPRLNSFMADRCSKLTPASKAIARRLEAKFHGPRRAH